MTTCQLCDALTSDDAHYDEFVASISVNEKELAVLISMPDVASVEHARAYVRTAAVASETTTCGRMGREIERIVAHLRNLAIMLSPFGIRHGRNHRT